MNFLASPKNTQSIKEKNHQFTRDSFGTIATKFILVGLKMGMGIITARFLGPTGKGVYYSTMQTSGMAATIGTLSMGESFIFLISRGRIAVRQFRIRLN